MADDLVVVGRYGDELSAQISAAVLDANGIPSKVVADTAGGAFPSLAVIFPVRLIVRAEDEALARELLESGADDSPDAPDEDDEPVA